MSLARPPDAGGPRDVILGESSPGAVLASIALARRIPGGAALMFGVRDRLAAALSTPAHRNRPRPWRLHVVGPDLSPASREETLAALRADPKDSLHWYDANIWTPEDSAELRGLTATGSWFNDSRTHHPFAAIDAAARSLSLLDDPFGETLLALAESRLSDEDATDWGHAWLDTLETLARSPLALVDAVRPLLHGMPAELAPLDRAEGEALRRELDDLFANSRVMQVPITQEDGSPGKAILLVLPDSLSLPPTPVALSALRGSECGFALVLYDRGDRAFLVGRHRGANPPVDVAAVFERLLRLPFVRRDRLGRGHASVLLADRPKDALERLVSSLL